MELIEIDKILFERLNPDINYCGFHVYRFAKNNHRQSHKCLVCGEYAKTMLGKPVSCNFSPTTNWNDYGEVLEWMKKEKSKDKMLTSWSLWDVFMEDLKEKQTDDNEFIEDILTNPETGSRAIASFLQEKTEKEIVK